MPGYHRLLVAYDGSPSGEDALALALRLRDADATLILACVVPGHPWHFPGHGEATRHEQEDALELLAEAQARIPAGVRVLERAPAAASAARGLTELAEAEGADVVVIGSAVGAEHGRIGIARTAGRLLQGAPCAVAISPPGGRSETGLFRHVGVAYDGSPEAATALAEAYAVAERCGAAMTIYSAIDQTVPASAVSRRTVQERLDAVAAAAPAGVNPRTEMLVGAPGAVIAGACEGVVDLLLAGSRGYGSLQRALVGSVSEWLVERATHPVVIVPRAPAAARSPERGLPAAAAAE
jgi:nucleotide-binding universal stress UspA family protein